MTIWNDLPAELKSVCVGKMDVLTRWSLRATSRDNKNLVDTQEIVIPELTITTDNSDHPCIEADFPFAMNFAAGETRKASAVLRYLLQEGKIGELKIIDYEHSHDGTEVLVEVITKIRLSLDVPFKLRKLDIMTGGPEFFPLIRNCQMEEFDFCCGRFARIKLTMILPMMLAAKTAHVQDLDFDGVRSYIRLIQNWLRTDKPVGSEAKVLYREPLERTKRTLLKDFGKVQKQFEKKIIEQGSKIREQFFRLKMNKSKKHILVQFFPQNVEIQIRVVEENFGKVVDSDSDDWDDFGGSDSDSNFSDSSETDY